MPRSEEALHEELRAGFAVLAGEVPPRTDIAAVVARGRRARRVRNLTLACPGVAVVALIAVLAAVAFPRNRPGTISTSLKPAPSLATATVFTDQESLGRVGDYVATYLPDTTVKPARTDPLTYEGGRCVESPNPTTNVRGCWSPAECQPGQDVMLGGPCNVGLTLEISRDAPFYTQLIAGTHPPNETVAAITVLGRPGYSEESGGGFFNSVAWRLADGQVAQARGSNFSAADVLAFADGLAYRPGGAAPAPTPSQAPSPDPVPVDAVDARPAGPAPGVRELTLPEKGSAEAVAGNGWNLDIDQGDSGPGAASVGIDDATGHGHSSAFIYSRVDQKPIPLTGLLGATVASFDSGGRHHAVVAGAVPRGTTGVGVLDTSGHRGWATLVEPGPKFDTLFFAYEPPGDAAITGLQSFDAKGPTGAQLPPYPARFPVDTATAGDVRRAAGDQVVFDGVRVSAIPAGIALGAAPCSPENQTATQACWGGTVGDPAAAAAARQMFGTDSVLLDVTVDHTEELPATGRTTTRIGRAIVEEFDQGPAVLLRFTDSAGHPVFIRGVNLNHDEVVAVAASMVG